MKKIVCVLISLICAVKLAACGSSSGSSGVSSSEDYVKSIGEKIKITDKTTMAADMIGAEDGTSFRYNGNKFEVYRFKSGDPKLDDAESGTLVYTLEGFGDFTSNSSVNGEYIMIYDTPEDKVIETFKSIS